MAGRRIVEVAKLFNASRAIASKHIALRSNQLEVYNKTSTLAKAVKSQTDRVTLTAAAAIALSKRFSEEAPAYAKAAADRATGAQHGRIPEEETVRRHAASEDAPEGFEQDHHYNRSEQNTATEPPPHDELEIKQKDAPRRPLPDGTIPSQDVTLEQEDKGRDTFSERPVGEAPKQPLAEEPSTSKDEGIRPVESDESTIPLPGQPRGTSKQAAESIPAHANDFQPSKGSKFQKLQEGHDRDVFYARSVESKPPTSSTPRERIPEHTGTVQESDSHVEDARLNQDVFYSAGSSSQQQQGVKKQEEDIPEGINTDVFHSKRVARMLGTDPFSRKEHTERQQSGRHPLDDRPLPEANTGARHPLDDRPLPQANRSRRHPLDDRPIAQPEVTPQAPTSRAAKATDGATSEKEMQDLASKLAADVESNTAAAEVL